MSTLPTLWPLDTPIRRVTTAESPLAGTVHSGMRLYVDINATPDALWRARPDGHLLTPRDVVRTDGGHAAVFALCERRLSDAVAQRHGPGTCVTIAVSILRGAAEADELGEDGGSWWIDPDGRPVLCLGEGRWRDEAGALLRHCSDSAPGVAAEVLRDCAALVADPRLLRRSAEAMEERLFAIADPRPLGDAATSPAPHAAIGFRDVGAGQPHREPDVHGADEPKEPGFLTRALRSLVDAPWRARLEDAGESARRALRARRASATGGRADRSPEVPGTTRARRGRLALTAGIAAGGVIALGALWPAAADPGESMTRGAAESAPPASATPMAVPAAEDGTDSDLLSAAASIIAVVAACTHAGDDVCADVREDPSRELPSALRDVDPQAPPMILDEYGGVAVVTVSREAGRSAAMVLVEAEGKWLVRDAYELADQPSP